MTSLCQAWRAATGRTKEQAAEYLAVSYRLIDQMETTKGTKYRRAVSARTRRLIERDVAERGIEMPELVQEANDGR